MTTALYVFGGFALLAAMLPSLLSSITIGFVAVFCCAMVIRNP